jgi:Tat protein translocase TatB subunit
MFDIGLQEMLVIGVLALLVFGPSKLPELGRMFGRAMREFRRASDEFRATVETNLHINEFEAPSGSSSYSMASESPAADNATATATDDGAVTSVADQTGLREPSPSEETSAEPFWAQRGSRLFHRRECAWARRIPDSDRVYLKKVGEAREQGFATCPVCEPWEPA